MDSAGSRTHLQSESQRISAHLVCGFARPARPARSARLVCCVTRFATSHYIRFVFSAFLSLLRFVSVFLSLAPPLCLCSRGNKHNTELHVARSARHRLAEKRMHSRSGASLRPSSPSSILAIPRLQLVWFALRSTSAEMLAASIRVAGTQSASHYERAR